MRAGLFSISDGIRRNGGEKADRRKAHSHSQLIDDEIEELIDWQSEMLNRLRTLIRFSTRFTRNFR